MKSASRFAVVLVTAPDLKTARALARGALKAKLAACANLIPAIESHYWWKDGLERGNEVLMLLKTRVPLLARLEQFVMEHHPYDTPEFLVLRPTAGTARYLAWLEKSVR